jgi:hypothetical protein
VVNSQKQQQRAESCTVEKIQIEQVNVTNRYLSISQPFATKLYLDNGPTRLRAYQELYLSQSTGDKSET